MKKTKPIDYTANGTLIINPDSDAANADWMRAARLKRRANEGDQDAARELEEMENTPLYVED